MLPSNTNGEQLYGLSIKITEILRWVHGGVETKNESMPR
jgi:hypothetical protein